MGKKGEIILIKKELFVSLLLVLVLLVSTQSSNAASCDIFTDTSACGLSIADPGQGAVELCSNCYSCGVLDGVCPEDFASNESETDADKKTILVRVGDDRPNGLDDPVIYTRPSDACSFYSSSSTCDYVENKSSFSSPWVADGIGCNTDITGFNKQYIQVKCNSPKTAGCQNCPDPDCTTLVRGLAFDNITNNSMNININIVSGDNLRTQNNSPTGNYTLVAPRGYANLTCTAQDYLKYEKKVFLQKGENIFDCRMKQASCTPSCTLPNINGVDVCRAQCDDQNSCNYVSPEIQTLCDGVPVGSTIVVSRINDTHVNTVTCCTGDFVPIERPLIIAASGDVPDLLTRDYRKIMGGIPVTLRIITYATGK